MKKSIKILLIIISALMGLYLLLIAVGPLVVLTLHPWKLKKDLDNPIVNGNYQGWSTVAFDEHLQIMLPEDWTIERENRIAISNENGDIVILAERFELGGSHKQLLLQLLSDCAGHQVSEYALESFGSNRFGNSASVAWFYIGDGEKVTSVTFQHSDANSENEYYYTLCFIGTNGDYCEEAEAIAWSMEDE